MDSFINEGLMYRVVELDVENVVSEFTFYGTFNDFRVFISQVPLAGQRNFGVYIYEEEVDGVPFTWDYFPKHSVDELLPKVEKMVLSI